MALNALLFQPVITLFWMERKAIRSVQERSSKKSETQENSSYKRSHQLASCISELLMGGCKGRNLNLDGQSLGVSLYPVQRIAKNQEEWLPSHHPPVSPVLIQVSGISFLFQFLVLRLVSLISCFWSQHSLKQVTNHRNKLLNNQKTILF